MWKNFLQIFITIFHIVFTRILNIIACILLTRLLREWLNFHAIISIFIADYCISKIRQYIQYYQLKDRLKKKESDEIIDLDLLSFQSSNYFKFEHDWQILLNNERENLLPYIVNVLFHNRWLFFTIIIVINYQLNTSISSCIQTIILIIIIISGSAIRYQTLYEREQEKNLNLFERWIIYSKNIFPILSIGIERIERNNEIIYTIKSYQLNSKFNDYFYDLVCFTCQNLIEWIKINAINNKKSIRLIWPVPNCKFNWTNPLKSKGFISRKTYRDFTFMPLIHSYVQLYQYEQLFSIDNNENKKDQ